MHGIGFLLADRLANHIGIRGDFPLRVQAGVLHVLREMAERGHCYADLAALKRNAAALLSIEEDPVEAAVDQAGARGAIWFFRKPAMSGATMSILEELYHAERRVAAAFQSFVDDAVVGPAAKESRAHGIARPALRAALSI